MRHRTTRGPSRLRPSPLRVETLESRTVPAVSALLQVGGSFGLEQVVVGTIHGNGNAFGLVMGVGNATHTSNAAAHVTFVTVTSVPGPAPVVPVPTPAP